MSTTYSGVKLYLGASDVCQIAPRLRKTKPAACGSPYTAAHRYTENMYRARHHQYRSSHCHTENRVDSGTGIFGPGQLGVVLLKKTKQKAFAENVLVVEPQCWQKKVSADAPPISVSRPTPSMIVDPVDRYPCYIKTKGRLENCPNSRKPGKALSAAPIQKMWWHDVLAYPPTHLRRSRPRQSRISAGCIDLFGERGERRDRCQGRPLLPGAGLTTGQLQRATRVSDKESLLADNTRHREPTAVEHWSETLVKARLQGKPLHAY